MIGSVKVVSIPSMNVSVTKATVQYVKHAKMIQSKGLHSNVLSEELSEQWQIGLRQARKTITKATQRLTLSSVMPLSRRY